MFSEVLPTNIFEYSFVLVISNQSLGLSKYIDKKMLHTILSDGEKSSKHLNFNLGISLSLLLN